MCYNIPTEFGCSENGWRYSLYRCLIVGGRAASAEVRGWPCSELAAEQILAVVADTRVRNRAPKEKGFCGRGLRAELAGAKLAKEKRASIRVHARAVATPGVCGHAL